MVGTTNRSPPARTAPRARPSKNTSYEIMIPSGPAGSYDPRAMAGDGVEGHVLHVEELLDQIPVGMYSPKGTRWFFT